MSESTLSLTYKEVLSRLGEWLGYGYGADFGDPAWGDREARHLANAVKDGAHLVYQPPVLPGDAAPHRWSWLRPLSEVRLDAGASSAPLPDDFNGFGGSAATVHTTDGVSYWPVEVAHEPLLRARQAADPNTTGRPRLVAEQARRGTTRTSGQRYDALVWPTTDRAYTLWATYDCVPSLPDDAHPYFYGGPLAAQLVLAACLAQAESRRDGFKGPMWDDFAARLAAAVGQDRRRRGDRLGYNGDRAWPAGGVPPGPGGFYGGLADTRVTVNGVLYGG